MYCLFFAIAGPLPKKDIITRSRSEMFRWKQIYLLRSFHSGMVFFAIGAWILIALCPAGEPRPNAAQEVELLRDPGFSHGVTQGYANHLPPTERADCLLRWKQRGIGEAQWAFWEISEQQHFAHNPDTPLLPRPRSYVWSTTDKSKQCLIEDGIVRFLIDTSKEWREGGSLNMPDTKGRRPKYGDTSTTWPHFLVGQHFARDNDPATVIPDDEKLLFDKFRQLRLGIDAKLNRLQKSDTQDHRAEFQAANHAIFYVAIVLMPRSASRLAEMGKFYMLVPAIYSEGNERHVPGSAPWLGLDQFGDSVYFSGAQPTLQSGKWVDYDIDVKQLIREGLAAATQKTTTQGKPRTYHPEDYYLGCLLIGWEVWGGFDTDVEFKNLTLRGVR